MAYEVVSEAPSQGQYEVISNDPQKKWTVGESLLSGIKNSPQSAGHLLGGLATAAMHPSDTMTNLENLAGGGIRRLLPQSALDSIGHNARIDQADATYNAAADMYSNRYGSKQGFLNTIATDPYAILGDASTVLGGGAGLANLGSKGAALSGAVGTATKAQALAQALSKGAKLTNPLAPLTIPVTKGAGLVGKTGDVLANALPSVNASNRVSALLSDLVGNDAAQTAQILRTAQGNTAGFNPTTAQAANHGGIAAMSRAYQAKNPAAFNERIGANNLALADAIKGIGKTPEDIALAEAARSTATGSLYDQANALNITGTPELTALLGRDSMKIAAARAESLARERGNLGFKMPLEVQAKPGTPAIPPVYSGRTLQDLKMGLDDNINSQMRTDNAPHQLYANRGTRNEYMDWLDRSHPIYAQANKVFADMSKPIDQMSVGQKLYNFLVPAANDASEASIPSLNVSRYATALRHGDTLAAGQTGMPQTQLSDIMTPEQMATIQNVSKDASSIYAGNTLGLGVGSNTAQNLSALDQAGALAAKATGKVSFVRDMLKNRYDMAFQQQMIDALLNPRKAADILTPKPLPAPLDPAAAFKAALAGMQIGNLPQAYTGE